MTDLKPATGHLSDAQLDAIAALDVNLGDDRSIQAADHRHVTDLEIAAARGKEARRAAREYRRGLLVDYLLTVETAAAAPANTRLAAQAEKAHETLALYLVAEGEYPTVEDAAAAVESGQVYGTPVPGKNYAEVPF
jgi:hypothetical protein